jgi:hypothetical protein
LIVGGAALVTLLTSLYYLTPEYKEEEEKVANPGYIGIEMGGTTCKVCIKNDLKDVKQIDK